MKDRIIEGYGSRPFITLFSEPRGRSIPLPGQYDEELQVVVSNNPGEKTPLIRIHCHPEAFTKTKIDRESDDNPPIFLETVTKTAAARESDDVDIKHLPELLTKTEMQREGDDERLFSLELQTKTRMDREGDDNHSGF